MTTFTRAEKRAQDAHLRKQLRDHNMRPDGSMIDEPEDFPQIDKFSATGHRRPQADYDYKQWLQHFAEMGSRCYWCETPLTESTVTKDHLQPISRFGEDKLSNIVPACFQCNCKKGNKNEEEFLAYKEGRFHGKRTGRKLKGVIHKDLLRANFVGTVNDYMEKYSKEQVVKLRNESEGGSWAWRNPPAGQWLQQNRQKT